MVDIETAVNRIVNGFKEVQRQTIMISGAKCSENIFWVAKIITIAWDFTKKLCLVQGLMQPKVK